MSVRHTGSVLELLVFYFVFVAVGAVLLKEKAEDRKQQRELAKQELRETDRRPGLYQAQIEDQATQSCRCRESTTPSVVLTYLMQPLFSR